jgi:hypothetical protein
MREVWRNSMTPFASWLFDLPLPRSHIDTTTRLLRDFFEASARVHFRDPR